MRFSLYIKRWLSQINELIAQACQAPESYLEMRKIQLRELAMLNGTLRAEDILGKTFRLACMKKNAL